MSDLQNEGREVGRIINIGLDYLRETDLAEQSFTFKGVMELDKGWDHALLFEALGNPERVWEVSAKLPGEDGKVYLVWVSKFEDGHLEVDTLPG